MIKAITIKDVLNFRAAMTFGIFALGAAVAVFALASSSQAASAGVNVKARPGRKIVVIEQPGRAAMESLRISVKFEVQRPVSTCNVVRLFGSLESRETADSPLSFYLSLDVRKEAETKTLKYCPKRTEQTVIEILTDWAQPQPFLTDLVFEVPEDVVVTGTLWQPIAEIPSKPY